MPTATEPKAKAVDSGAANTALGNLEKYHIAGQGYMAAPRMPESEELGKLPEREARSDRDVVKMVAGRISAEEALRIAGKAGKSAGGYYYPVAEEEDEDDNGPILAKKDVVSKPSSK